MAVHYGVFNTIYRFVCNCICILPYFCLSDLIHHLCTSSSVCRPVLDSWDIVLVRKSIIFQCTSKMYVEFGATHKTLAEKSTPMILYETLLFSTAVKLPLHSALQIPCSGESYKRKTFSAYCRWHRFLAHCGLAWIVSQDSSWFCCLFRSLMGCFAGISCNLPHTNQ